MAFFERTDERDKLVVCNICNVKCAERSMTGHRMKCSVRHKDKFTKNLLVRCIYDSGHIVAPGDLDDHLEFCTKRQGNLVSEFQTAMRRADNQVSGVREPEHTPILPSTVEIGDDWNKQAEENPYHFPDLSRLRLS